jgi:hypothetical protein
MLFGQYLKAGTPFWVLLHFYYLVNEKIELGAL